MFGAVLNRLATSVRRALSQYAVGANEPELALNFIDNEYITNNSASTFASAVTHARNSNATMTDGYGPELVTNGGFDSGTDSWTASNADFSVSDGIAYFKSTGAGGSISQTISTVAGKLYEITFNGKYSSGDPSAFEVEGVLEYPNSIGISVSAASFTQFRAVFTATGSSHVIKLRERGGANNASSFIDNVSVREMPVIKWAPHNLLTYSEDFSNSDWGKIAVSVSSNLIVASASSGIHVIRNGVGVLPSGVLHTQQLRAKAGGYDWCALWFDGIGKGAYFNLSTGTIGTVSAGVTANISSSVDSEGYYLLTVSTEGTGVSTTSAFYIANGDGSSSFLGDGVSGHYIDQWRLYRSDLGGMVDNPDQPLSRASYVPTTSAAKYLPRIGHHVYNGSAWANEGLLAESEARTNLITQSNEFDGADWDDDRLTITPDSAVSPDGTENAYKLAQASGQTQAGYINQPTNSTSGNSYVASVYAKAGTNRDYIVFVETMASGSAGYSYVDLTTGTAGTVAAAHTVTIQDVGNGWYRVAFQFDCTSSQTGGVCSFRPIETDGSTTVTDDQGFIYVYGAQLEEGSTPSSFCPTNGQQCTKEAETFTIPSANLPWPSPNYIGSELVINGGFDDTSQWGSIAAGCDISGGTFNTDGTSTGELARDVSIGITAGKVYRASYEITARSAGELGIKIGGGQTSRRGTTGVFSFIFVADATMASANNVQISSVNAIGSIDNVSVREIDPLSVSIATDGRVSYADEDSFDTVTFSKWEADSDNRLVLRIDTSSTRTGRVQAVHRASGTENNSSSSSNYFDPDILIPYDIAARFGSTFSQGGESGVAFNANTGPTELPDLSSSDLNLAHDYMGTVGTFRIWDKDITDDGLVEATNPSLEPSLSLTFEGTGTNSFVVNNWSE